MQSWNHQWIAPLMTIMPLWSNHLSKALALKTSEQETSGYPLDLNSNRFSAVCGVCFWMLELGSGRRSEYIGFNFVWSFSSFKHKGKSNPFYSTRNDFSRIVLKTYFVWVSCSKPAFDLKTLQTLHLPHCSKQNHHNGCVFVFHCISSHCFIFPMKS